MDDATPGKLCRKCGQLKPAGDFSPNRQVKNGLSTWCRSCHRDHGRSLSYNPDPLLTEKRCAKCELVKPTDQFSRNRRNKTGLSSACKPCQKERHRDWYERNSESVIARTKRWGVDNPERYKVLSRQRQIRRLYGLSPAEYDGLLGEQRGRCAGCGDLFGDTRPHVDHDHETGAVRGLLCGPCNKSLGMAGDSPDRLIGLARYLGADVWIRGAS